MANASNLFDSAGVSFTAATQTISGEAHANKPLVFNRAAGVVATLPASTGNGDRFTFVVGTAVTSNSVKVQVANATDVMRGNALLLADGGDTVVGFATAAASDTITLDGSTTGGLLGARIECVDMLAGFWSVNVISDASGTEATPFSAAVS